MKNETIVQLYIALIAYFFYYSNGFVKFHGEYYAVFKTIPVLVLSLFAFLRNRGRVALLILLGGIGDYIIGIPSGGIVPGSFPFGSGHLIALSLFAFKRTFKIFWPTAIGLLLLQATVGHFCIKPMLSSEPTNALILSVYSFTLAACFIVSSSHYFRSSVNDLEYTVCILN
ncbi:hypothetical protein WR25_03381 [Diploscapter pachys]|uniref:lysoplasmalogenase n=1 Tax=Diploscapter pachys TaxID=2018661 RepID=A0A2A2LL28_9BILA|nr:hypothetical protein WR25_03381 [Diploscapter pachys]